jgi:hypothetical protein
MPCHCAPMSASKANSPGLWKKCRRNPVVLTCW